MSLLTADALAIAEAVRTKKATATEVAHEFLSNIDAQDSKFNCFTDVTRQRALHEAGLVDAAIAAGKPIGPLAGVPYAAKNLFDVEGITTLAGSKINADRPPAARDAAAVDYMRQAGAVLVGALNMDEYAYGFTTENSHYGAVRNPHDTTKIAGGSSGGSAAAVAGGLVPLSLGTDTNGSVRLPSALCGVFGIKPTFSRLNRTGAFPLAASLDAVGAFARNANDLASCYQALMGPDAEPDSRSSNVGGEIKARDLRIGIADDYFERYSEDEAREAVDTMARAFSAVRKVTLPEAERARAGAFVITGVEAGNLHFDNLRKRPQDFEPLSKDRLLAGAISPASWYVQAQRFRRWFRDEVAKVFANVDVILAPASPRSATPIGAKSVNVRGRDLVPRAYMGMLTQPISFIGLPVVTVPFVKKGQMPLGVQVIAAPWREDICLSVAKYLQDSGIAHTEIAPGARSNADAS